MKALLRSLTRITLGVLVGLGLIIAGVVALIRQPSFGADPVPQGPRAEAARLRQHVERLCGTVGSRNASSAGGADGAARYIEEEFTRTGAAVSRQEYRAGAGNAVNVIARFGPETGERVVIGAHYDVFGDLPGADDNTSGSAGLIELARLLDGRPLARPVELVAYSTEEPPFFGGPGMGSAVHARRLSQSGAPVRAMIGLEMIGFFSDRQPCPIAALCLAYPRRGDFIAIVGRWEDRALARRLKRAFRGATDVPAVSYSGPVAFGSDLSDHRNYWAEGFSAVMVTDTAYLRNRNYHTDGDVPESLDYRRMAGVVDGVLAATLTLQSDAPR